jgi:uncharacterized protein
VPRSPEPELIRFMLLESPADRDAALKTLRALATSAVRDPLDGGFFRHAADAAWHIPYQQKTLADQARITLAFLDGAKGADAVSFDQCARGALGYVLGRLAVGGGFAAAEDGTADEYAGYFAWTEAEIDKVLGADSPAFKLAHGVMPDGNIPASDDPSAQYSHKNILRSAPGADARDRADAGLLLGARDGRGALPRDVRATAGAYGLLLSAFSRAAEHFKDGAYLSAARGTLADVRAHFLSSPGGALRRLGDSDLPAAADDYAAMALGCRDYAHAANDRAAAALADSLLSQLDARYYDPASCTYFGAPTPLGAGFFIRPFPADDPPSAESLALTAGAPHVKAVAAALSASLEESSAQAPGDELLALALCSAQ